MKYVFISLILTIFSCTVVNTAATEPNAVATDHGLRIVRMCRNAHFFDMIGLLRSAEVTCTSGDNKFDAQVVEFFKGLKDPNAPEQQEITIEVKHVSWLEEYLKKAFENAVDWISLEELKAYMNNERDYKPLCVGSSLSKQDLNFRAPANKTFVQNRDGDTGFIVACRNNDEQAVKMLLALRDREGRLVVDINAQNSDGDTGLMVACRNNDEQVVQMLLALRDRQGRLVVDINAHNSDGDTALSIAMWHNNKYYATIFPQPNLSEHLALDAACLPPDIVDAVGEFGFYRDQPKNAACLPPDTVKAPASQVIMSRTQLPDPNNASTRCVTQ